jgi:hypothetical protein
MVYKQAWSFKNYRYVWDVSVILMTFVCLLYSINCPTVICLPNVLFILWRDTTSELWTLVHSFTLLLPFTSFIYILANYYLLPLDMLNPLFTTNRWDWQPHCKLGQSTWLCCVQVHIAAGAKLRPGRGTIYKLSEAVAKLASINLRKLVLSPTSSINLGSYWGKTCCCAHHTFLLGFPTGRSSTCHQCLTGPVGKPQEEGMMSTAVSFPPVWNQGLIDQ